MSHDDAALYHSKGYNAQLANTVTASSTTSAGVRHLIQLSATPTKLWFLPMNWRSETRLSSTRSAFCGTIATSEFKTHRYVLPFRQRYFDCIQRVSLLRQCGEGRSRR